MERDKLKLFAEEYLKQSGLTLPEFNGNPTEEDIKGAIHYALVLKLDEAYMMERELLEYAKTIF